MKELVGRICVKTAGREAGLKCVIVEVAEKNFVVVTGPAEVNGFKRRKVNVMHLAFTPHQLNLGKNVSDERVIKALEEEKMLDFMKEKVTGIE